MVRRRERTGEGGMSVAHWQDFARRVRRSVESTRSVDERLGVCVCVCACACVCACVRVCVLADGVLADGVFIGGGEKRADDEGEAGGTRT